MQHIFDIEIAKKYGVNIAIFLNNMAFWIQKNVANQKHYHQGKYWTYNSQSAFIELFPYWSRQTIRTTIDKCIKNKLIIKGNFNKSSYDHTTWYTLTKQGLSLFPTLEMQINAIGENQPMKKLKSTNQSDEINQPIPDNKPDVRTDKREVKAKKVKKKNPLKKETEARETYSLSFFDNPDNIFNFIINNQMLKRCERNGIDPSNVLEKFIIHIKDKGLKEFSRSQLNIWCLREIDYMLKRNNGTTGFKSSSNHYVNLKSPQTQCTVKFYEDQNNKECRKEEPQPIVKKYMAENKEKVNLILKKYKKNIIV